MNTIFATADISACRTNDQRLLVRLCVELLKLSCVVGLMTSQSGCYTPNQRAFESLVNNRVTVGMSLTTAVLNLRAMHMQCSGTGPITCDRIRQRLLPSSCIERAVLSGSPAGGLVETLEIRPIICAGL